MAGTSDNPIERFQDWINLILGALLFISPWLLGFADQTMAAWNAWIAGAVVVALSIAALVRFAEWEEWVNIVVGLWILISPWVLGFAGINTARWTCVILGIVIAAMAAWEAWTTRHPTQAAA
jgi:hypothetical protein